MGRRPAPSILRGYYSPRTPGAEVCSTSHYSPSSASLRKQESSMSYFRIHIVRQHSEIASEPSIFLGLTVSKRENHENPSFDQICSQVLLLMIIPYVQSTLSRRPRQLRRFLFGHILISTHPSLTLRRLRGITGSLRSQRSTSLRSDGAPRFARSG